MKVGVVIGRFQIPALHSAHTQLLNAAAKASDKLVVLVGVAPFRSEKNPLPYEYREKLFKQWQNVTVLPVFDVEDDAKWSEQVDAFLLRLYPGSEITLFHGDKSFAPRYSGKLQLQHIVIASTERASYIRKKLANHFDQTPQFAAGVIHAIGTQFQRPQMTVDFGLVDLSMGKPGSGGKILLGRRSYEPYWRLPGGMVDPTDLSLEHAAARELLEETGMTPIDAPTYLGSFQIDDWRVRGTEQRIMSAIFTGQYQSGIPKGMDDIHEVGWFYWVDALEMIGKQHLPLLKRLKEYWNV